MANNDGKIVLGLDISATRAQIQSDLNNILGSTKTKQIVLNTAIEKDETKKSVDALVKSLNDEADKVKLGVEIDTTVVQGVLKQQQKIASEQEKLNRQMQEYESIAKNAGLTLDKNILNKFKKAIDTGDLSKAEEAVKSFKKQIDGLNRMNSDSTIERNVSSMVDKFNQLKNVSAETQSRVKLLKANLAQYEKADSTNKKISAYNRLYTLLDQLETEYNQLKIAEKNYANSNDIQSKYKDAKSLYENMSKMYSTADGKAADGLKNSLQALSKVLSDFEKNSKGLSGGKLAAEWEKVEVAIDDVTRSVSEYKAEISSTKELSKSLTSITNKISDSIITSKDYNAPTVDTDKLDSQLQELYKRAGDLKTRLENLDPSNGADVKSLSADIENLSSDFLQAEKAIKSAKQQTEEYNKAVSKMNSDTSISGSVSSIINKFNQLGKVSSDTQGKIDLLKRVFLQFETADSTSAKLDAYNSLKSLLDQLEVEYKQLSAAEKNYAKTGSIESKYKEAEELQKSLSKLYSNADGELGGSLKDSLGKLKEALDSFSKNKDNLSVGQLAAEWEKVEAAIQDAKKSVQEYDNAQSSIGKLDGSLKSITDKIDKSLSSLGNSKASNTTIEMLKTGYEQLAKQAENLKASLSNLDLFDGTEVSKFLAEVEKLEAELKELQAIEQASAKQVSYDKKIASAKSYLEALKQTYSTLGNSKGAEKLKASIDALDKALSEAAANPAEESMALEWNNVDKAMQGVINSVKEYRAEFASIGKLDGSIESLTKKISSAMDAVGSSGAFGAGVDRLNSQLQELHNRASDLRTRLADLDPSNGSDVKNLSTDVENLSAEFQQLSKDIKTFGDGTEFDKFQAKVQKAQQAVESYADTYSAIKSRPDLVKELEELQKASKNIANTKELEQYNAKFDQFNTKVKAAGVHCKSLGDQLKTAFTNFAQFFSASHMIYQLTETFKDMVENVKELDKAMIELRKVTDETDEAYESFLTNTKTRAVELGTTVKDLVSATADFSRLGYTLEESTKLGEIATIYANVGDDVGSIDQATTSLISTMKGFGLETSDALSIVDKFNEVGNKFAISSGGIGDALQRSAASLKAGGNTIDQAISLIVAANNVIQDEDVVGNMWKTVSMRIRGAKVELEEAGLETEYMAESTSTLRDTIMAITNIDGGGGFDILTDSGAFKSTYDIILGIAQVWERLGETDPIGQAALLELLAGEILPEYIEIYITNILNCFDTLRVFGSKLIGNMKII